MPMRGRNGALRKLGLLVAAIVVVALWGTTASALAGAPITLSTSGSNPDVAVDSAGTAHIVWDGTGSAAGNLEYCQIPAGGTACADAQSFPTTDEGNARVLLGPSAEEVVLLDTGAGGTDTAVNAWVSMDGGQTFSSGPNGAGGVVGGGFTTQGGSDADRFDTDQRPAFGPGGFGASWMDGDGYYENFPVNAGPPVDSGQPSTTSQDTQLFTTCGYPDPDSIALLNSTTPVAECVDSPSGAVYYRVGTGQGNVNDASTGSWGPVQSLPGEGGAQGAWIAGGSRGVYLLYNAPDGSADVRALVNGTFGAPVKLADNTFVEGFSEDPTGNLFAVTQDPEFGSTTNRQQRVFTSPDGVNWTEVPLDLTGVEANSGNASAQVAGCAAAGAGSTGSGFITFNSVASASPNTIYAESFGAAPCGGFQGTGNCPTHLTVGAAQLIATSGCFTAGPGGTYTTAGQVEMNGLLIAPAGASSHARHEARAAVAGQLVIDTVNKTISSAGSPTVIQASNIVLGKQSLDWLLPGAGGGDLTDVSQNGHGLPVSFDPSAIGSKVLGFAISGQVTPDLEPQGMASLPVNVTMPSPIGGFIGSAPTDDLPLTTANSIPGGLSLSPGSVTISIPTVSLGIAELHPFTLSYDSDPEVFDGDIGLQLPVIGNGFDMAFEFQQGRFVYGKLDIEFGNDVPLFPDVFLQKVNILVAARRGNVCAMPATMNDGPTQIGGGVTVAVGPVILGKSLFSVDGEATYTFPESSCHEPGVFAITGTGKIVGFPVATAGVSFATDGNVALNGSLGIGSTSSFGIFAGFEGDVGFHKPFPFYAGASGDAYVFGIKVPGPSFAISSVGTEACLPLLGYVEYKWHGGLSGGWTVTCSFDDLKPEGFASRAGVAGASIALQVPRRSSGEEIELRTGSGVPSATLDGPHGERVVIPALAAGKPGSLTVTPAADIGLAAAGDYAVIRLNHPAAGRWTIQPAPGSPKITGLLTAQQLPPVHVHAHVTASRGPTRSLVYRSTPLQGRSIAFVETGAGNVRRVIATVRREQGRIRFQPEYGPGGRRKIVAQITQRGFNVGRPVTVATYTAPGPVKLTRPQNVKVRRHGTRITISWDRVAGAARYVVRAILHDGRSLVFLRDAGAHTVTVRSVPGFDAGKVMVAALDAVNQPGPIGTVKLKALKATCLKPRAVRGKLVCAKPKHKKPRHKKPRHGKHHG